MGGASRSDSKTGDSGAVRGSAEFLLRIRGSLPPSKRPWGLGGRL